jgi:putative hydrolase of the HAD superfamily
MLCKLDPRIHQMMVEAPVSRFQKLCPPYLAVNLNPARDVGMTTIKVHNASKAIDELEAATGLSLR